MAIDLLQVDNLFKLRDKYEGQAFYNRLSLRLFCVLTLERFLGAEFLDINQLKDNESEITLNKIGLEISICPFIWGELPIVIKDRVNSSIFMVQKGPKDIYLCGYIDKQNLFLESNFKKVISPLWRDKYEFTGFDKLVKFNNIDELVNLNTKIIK